MNLCMEALVMTIETIGTVACLGKTASNKWHLKMDHIPTFKGMEV
jgi:hypothetical protein